MIDWAERISVQQISEVLQKVILKDEYNTERALIFHNLEAMYDRFSLLMEHFPSNTLHAIAIKANPVLKILNRLVSAGAGLEAASFEEVHLALAAGCKANKIVFDSPVKTREELRESLAKGISINVDNLEELERIDAILAGGNTACDIGLRFNPEVGGGSIKLTSVAERSSKFGITLSSIGEDGFVSVFKRYPWLTGLHVHVGSQGCQITMLAEAVERAVKLRNLIHAKLGREKIRTIDIGGGLAWTYDPEYPASTLDDYVDVLKEYAPEIFEGKLKIITEFGRSIQAGCGWAASRVEYVKQIDGKPVAVIHLGADFLLRRIYQSDEWYHELLVLDHSGKQKPGNLISQSVVGPLCFAGDVLATDITLPIIKPGDWIIFRDVGAYTLSLWSRHCSRGIPEVIGYEGSSLQFSTLRASEKPEDIVNFWKG